MAESIRQKAEREAEAAEAEFPDEPEAEPAPDEAEEAEQAEESEEGEPAEPEQRQARSQDPQKAFDRAMRAFGEKLKVIFETDELTPAPHPGVVGFMLPGFAEPKTHEDFTGCQTCNTLGKILTGANTGDPNKDWHVCPDTRCKGNGFWQRAKPTQALPATGPLAVQPQVQDNGEFAEAPAWMGDPNLTPQA